MLLFYILYKRSIIIKHTILKSFALVTVFSVATRFLSFIYKIIISRYFGAEAVGIFQMSVSFLGFFIALTSSGLPLILSRNIAETRGKDKLREDRKVTFCLVFSILASLIITLALVICKPLLSVYFQNKKAVDVFYLLLPALFSTTIYAVIRAWLLGNKQFLTFSSTELLEEVLTIAVTVLLALTLGSISGEKIISLAVSLADFICIIVLFIIYFYKGGRLRKPRFEKELLKCSVPITASRLLASVLGAFSAFIIPYKLMEYGLNTSVATATFGRFTGMCMPLINAPSALIGSLAIVLLPELSSLKATKEANNQIEKSLLFAVFTAGAFVGLYLPLGKEITTLVFNDAISGTYVSYSAIIIFPLVINQLSTSVLNAIGEEKTTLKNFVIGSVPLIISITFLTKYLGVLSLALGFFLSFTTTAALNLFALTKQRNVSLGAYKKMLLITASSLLLSYLIKIIARSIAYSDLTKILICSVIFLILYLLVCYALGLSPKKLGIKLFSKRGNKNK